MIGGLTYESFARFWLEYEDDKTQSAIDKGWAEWSRKHGGKAPQKKGKKTC